MSISRGIRGALIADSTVNTLTGGRVYRKTPPQRANTPHVWFSRLATHYDRSLDGRTGLVEASIDVNCVAESGADRDTLTEAVIAVLDDKSGDMGGLSPAVSVLMCELRDRQDDVFIDGDKHYYIEALTFSIVYCE